MYLRANDLNYTFTTVPRRVNHCFGKADTNDIYVTDLVPSPVKITRFSLQTTSPGCDINMYTLITSDARDLEDNTPTRVAHMQSEWKGNLLIVKHDKHNKALFDSITNEDEAESLLTYICYM